jgi:hypothetical protein
LCLGSISLIVAVVLLVGFTDTKSSFQ